MDKMGKELDQLIARSKYFGKVGIESNSMPRAQL
jgi:hypothetical protein